MVGGPSLVEFIERRARLAGSAILDQGNPWFVALDRLREEIEAAGGSFTSFANYDYLGIANHPSVNAAATRAAGELGTGALGSRLVGGERTIHRDLENAIASFVGTEAALTLVSGYLTNVSLISHLLGPEDLLVMDEFCHNSIIAGARGTRAQVISFPHNDFDYLDRVLRDQRQSARNCLIAVEGLYSMDGDIPDLPRLLRLKDERSCWLLVDEAHSLGVLGATGRGISEHFGEDPNRIDLVVGTLSKALVSCGGFVCARKTVLDYLRFTLGGFVYSVGLSPIITAAAHAALEVIDAEPQRVAAAGRAGAQFVEKAKRAGLNTGQAIGRGIVPILFDDFEATMRASETLLRSNIYAPPIVHVGVPKELPRIRFFLSALHDGHPAIDQAVAILAQAVVRSSSASQDVTAGALRSAPVLQYEAPASLRKRRPGMRRPNYWRGSGTNVAEDVKSIIAQVLKLEPDALSSETRLSELAIDSIDMVEMIFKIEEKFDITITLEPKDSSFMIKMGADETEDVSLDNIGEIIQTVQKIVDAKAA